jgi:hypothetical protein
MASSPPPLAAGDLALLERLAVRVVDLRLEVPAILALETGKPLSLLASQAMIFFEPIAQALFPGADYRRYAALAERRDAIETLITQIETCSERARAERRAAQAARQRPR